MRVTDQHLHGLVHRINLVTNSPETPWTNGKANVGHYHLDWAYGGVKLDRMYNESGGVESVSIGGFITKRALFDWMDAWLRGYEFHKHRVCGEDL